MYSRPYYTKTCGSMGSVSQLDARSPAGGSQVSLRVIRAPNLPSSSGKYICTTQIKDKIGASQ